MTARAWAALLFVGGVWGASFLFVRVALDEVSPLQIVLFRTVTGAAVLSLLFGRRSREVAPGPRLAISLLALAVVSTVAPFFLISWAETRIDSGTTAVLNSVMPIFTLVLAATITRDERLTPRAVGGALLGVAGVALLSGAGGLGSSSLPGVAAVIGATACYSVGNIAVRNLVRSVPATFISLSNIVLSAALVTLLALVFDPPTFGLSWDVWASLLTLGVFGTGFAYIAYYWLIEHAGSFRSSLVTYVIPVVGVILGAAVLGEELRPTTVAGGALIVLGVAVGTGTLEALVAKHALADRR